MSFFFSVIFFILGLFLGKSGAVGWEKIIREAEPVIGAPLPQSPPPSSSSRDEELVGRGASITPLTNGQLPLEPDSSGAQASLEAFLSAQTWSARSAYVLYPNLIIPQMEASAKIHGDGAITVSKITLQQDLPHQKVFWLETPNNSRPFSVVLIKDGRNWLVDWGGFADFYHNRLRHFAQGREGPVHGVFRVFLKAAPGETSPLSPARCLVMAPHDEKPFQVNSAAQSPARKKLAEIFQAYLQADPESFEEAMKGPGIPLIVELSRNGAQNPTLRLEEILTTGWAPLSPEELKNGHLSSFY